MNSNKVAIVTGASRGIGKTVALGLAEDDYDLVLIARTESDLKRVKNQVEKFNVKSNIICTDITDFDYLTKSVNDVLEKLGRVDVLVNNAGILQLGSLDVTLDEYQTVYDINFKAQLVMMKIVLPFMQKQRHGLIANIASIAGKFGYANLGAYGSSKFALVGLSESLHNEYAAQNIKITAICPSYVATNMTKEADAPREQMIQPEDILQTIRWLLRLSPSAFVKEIIMNSAVGL